MITILLSKIRDLLIELKTNIQNIETSFSYSETEHKIGKWFDGSDVYEIALKNTSGDRVIIYPQSTNEFAVTGITDKYVSDIYPNIDIFISGNFIESEKVTDDSYLRINNICFNFNTKTGKFSKYPNPDVGYMGYQINKDSYFIIRYTKKTEV